MTGSVASAHRSVVVVGAGGHARVTVEVLLAMGHRVLGCVSNDAMATADIGVPILGDTAEAAALAAQHGAAGFVAVGNNEARARLCRWLEDASIELLVAVSPHAIVSPSATIGAGTLVMPGAVVNAGTRIGTGVIINTRASVDHDGMIGDFVHIAPGVSIAGNVTVEEGAFVGIGAAVIPGRTIGAWAQVGAGAAVVRDVASSTLVVGVPARPIERER